MNPPSDDLLLGIRGEVGLERKALKELLRSLSRTFKLKKISSLYIGSHEVRSQNRVLQCVSFCVLASAVQADGVAGQLAELKKEISLLRPHWREVLLLNWGGLVRIDPTLVLPHPDWHKSKYWLLPSVEIAGDLTHPILQRPLREILAEFADRDLSGVKFLDRSEGLLDFEST